MCLQGFGKNTCLTKPPNFLELKWPPHSLPEGGKKLKSHFWETYLGVKTQSWLFSLNNGEKIRSKSFTKRKLQACELNLSEAKNWNKLTNKITLKIDQFSLLRFFIIHFIDIPQYKLKFFYIIIYYLEFSISQTKYLSVKSIF